MPDLLVEIGCEELPASACREALAQVPELLRRSGAAVGLPLEATVWVAPRRIAAFVPDVPGTITGEARSVRGPAVAAAFGPDGAPTKAAEGFARGHGRTAAELVTRDLDGRAFVFADHPAVARDLREIVPRFVADIVDGIRFSKNMRWGDGAGLRFSRPVRWIVVKLGDETIPVTVHGLTAGDTSQGHRFLGRPAPIPGASGYRDALRAVAAIADQDERRATITAGLDAAAASLGCSWRDPGGKIEEVLHLVEWPSVITGTIAVAHLALPERVLVTAMQSHQRYFPLHRPDGALHGAFLAVSNGDPAHAELIARGNEGVLDARLQDATFSFEKDRAAGLEALNARLDTIVFHQRLGSLAQKRDRLVAGVADLARHADPGEEATRTALAAAALAKADQGAVLVAEFSELQGYVAAEYARLEGHPEAVSVAIEQQFLPEGPDSPLPGTPAAALVALSEKVDNLVGAFAIGEAPTSSKDPYGLRRAAAGLVRVLLDREWDIPLALVFEASYERFASQDAKLSVAAADVARDLAAFVADRLAYQLGTEGVGAEAAAAAAGAGLLGVVATARRARAIQQLREASAFVAAWTAATRCERLVAKAPSGSAFTSAGEPAEDAFFAAIGESDANVAQALGGNDVDGAVAALQPLVLAVDRFFADVMVNVDDEAARRRRYGLLDHALTTFQRVADFSQITQGGSAR